MLCISGSSIWVIIVEANALTANQEIEALIGRNTPSAPNLAASFLPPILYFQPASVTPQPHLHTISLARRTMDISDNLDSEIVDVARMTAAINSPCICQPLHRNCNPSTCDRAPSNSIVETDHFARKIIEGASSEDDFIQIICHRGELRHAALHGCVTCAILYAGIAGLNNAPVVGDDSWPSKTSDRRVNVRITPRGELLRCELSYAKKVTKNDKQPVKLAFYASENSGVSFL
jgi:hypothetical protein